MERNSENHYLNIRPILSQKCEGKYYEYEKEKKEGKKLFS